VFGIVGLDRIPYSPWLQPLFAAVMLVNVASIWIRARSTRRMSAFYLVTAGAVAILVSRRLLGWDGAAACGVTLTLAGSLLSVVNRSHRRSNFTSQRNVERAKKTHKPNPNRSMLKEAIS
jgi:hypothetical protein